MEWLKMYPVHDETSSDIGKHCIQEPPNHPNHWFLDVKTWQMRRMNRKQLDIKPSGVYLLHVDEDKAGIHGLASRIESLVMYK